MIADYEMGHVKPATYFARARREVRAALALDRDSAAAHTSLGMLRFAAEHDVDGSFAEFRRAIALDPNYAIAHHWYGTTLFGRGRLAEASRELHYELAGDLPDAIAAFRPDAVRLHPRDDDTAFALLAAGDRGAASPSLPECRAIPGTPRSKTRASNHSVPRCASEPRSAGRAAEPA